MNVSEISIPLLDIAVTPATTDEIVRHIVASSNDPDKTSWINNYNLHAAYLHHTDTEFRQACREADLSIIDGWPILLSARLTRVGRSLDHRHRVGSTDWLFRLLSTKWPVTITAIGSTPDSSRATAQIMAQEYPHVRWFSYDGYELTQTHDSPDPESLRGAVTKSDLVIVGMGMPIQEQWIAENIRGGLLRNKVVANVGGCLDYIAGEQRLAPRWVGAIGFEWLYRLIRSPRRLYHRYCIEPFLLAGVVMSRRRESGRLPAPRAPQNATKE